MDEERYFYHELLVILSTKTEQIEEAITRIFTAAYDDFLKQALEKLNEDILDTENELDIRTEQLTTLQNEIISESLKKVKAEITDIVKQTNDKYLSHRIMVVEDIYFPFYIDSKKLPFHSKTVKIMKYIKKTISTSTRVTIGFSTLFGGILGLGASYEIINNVDQPFRFIWDGDQKPIENVWISFQNGVRESFRLFLSDMKNDNQLNESVAQISTVKRKIFELYNSQKS